VGKGWENLLFSALDLNIRKEILLSDYICKKPYKREGFS